MIFLWKTRNKEENLNFIDFILIYPINNYYLDNFVGIFLKEKYYKKAKISN